MDVRVGLQRKLSTKELMFLNCGVVLVDEGIHPVNGVLDVSETEITPVIGLHGCIRALEEYGRVCLILVEHHGRSLDRLESVAVLDCSRHHHRIDPVSRREDKSIAREHISLVVVGNSVSHIKGVGPVAVEVILEIHHNTLVLDLELR